MGAKQVIALSGSDNKHTDSGTILSFLLTNNGERLFDNDEQAFCTIKNGSSTISVVTPLVGSKVQIDFSDSKLNGLSSGQYYAEFSVHSKTGIQIYPDTGFIQLNINANVKDISAGNLPNVSVDVVKQTVKDYVDSLNLKSGNGTGASFDPTSLTNSVKSTNTSLTNVSTSLANLVTNASSSLNALNTRTTTLSTALQSTAADVSTLKANGNTGTGTGTTFNPSSLTASISSTNTSLNNVSTSVAILKDNTSSLVGVASGLNDKLNSTASVLTNATQSNTADIAALKSAGNNNTSGSGLTYKNLVTGDDLNNLKDPNTVYKAYGSLSLTNMPSGLIITYFQVEVATFGNYNGAQYLKYYDGSIYVRYWVSSTHFSDWVKLGATSTTVTTTSGVSTADFNTLKSTVDTLNSAQTATQSSLSATNNTVSSLSAAVTSQTTDISNLKKSAGTATAVDSTSLVNAINSVSVLTSTNTRSTSATQTSVTALSTSLVSTNTVANTANSTANLANTNANAANSMATTANSTANSTASTVATMTGTMQTLNALIPAMSSSVGNANTKLDTINANMVVKKLNVLDGSGNIMGTVTLTRNGPQVDLTGSFVSSASQQAAVSIQNLDGFKPSDYAVITVFDGSSTGFLARIAPNDNTITAPYQFRVNKTFTVSASWATNDAAPTS